MRVPGLAMLVLGVALSMMGGVLRWCLLARVCLGKGTGADDVREQQRRGSDETYARSELEHVREHTPFDGTGQSAPTNSRGRRGEARPRPHTINSSTSGRPRWAQGGAGSRWTLPGFASRR